MDFSLTEEQGMLQKMARNFLTTECPKSLVRDMVEDERGYPPELWRKMAELGWMGLVIPEEYGGSGGSFLDLAIIEEEMGRALLPGPFFSTVVLGGLTILEAANDKQKRELLPRLAEGNLFLTLALIEPSDKYSADRIQVRAVAEGNGFNIQGTKLFVPDAHIANYLICVARTKDIGEPEDGITLFLVDSGSLGISCAPLKTIAGDKQYEVIFDNVKVSSDNILGEVDKGWYSIGKVLEKAAVARCAEMVGGMRQVLEMTVDYAKDRVAFGHPIGSYQAIAFPCADMLTNVEAGTFITYEAAWHISQGLPVMREAAIAKAWLSEKFRVATVAAHEIHGAVAFEDTHDLGLYFKHAKAWEISLGDAYFHLDKIGSEVGL